MRTVHLLLLSLLGLGVVATADATGVVVNGGDANCAQSSSTEGASSHDSLASGNSNGDATGLSRDPARHHAPSAPAATSPSVGMGGDDGGIGTETPRKHASLGWQSLLPGSIQ